MSSSLFVEEDEEDKVEIPSTIPEHTTADTALDAEDQEDDDDPIITEIPVVLKHTPSPDLEAVMLQYPSRPQTRPFTNESRILESRIKPKSNFIEVDIPIDTTKFYDQQKGEEWGNVNKQSLNGVMISLDGYYVANVSKGEIVMLPVKSTTQLRPSLKHIDKEIADKKELNRLDNQNNNSNHNNQNQGIQVVHMTVKNTSDNTPRLGGALLARKNVDEEEFQVYKWNDVNDASTTGLRKRIINDGVLLNEELIPLTSKEDYVDLLVQETIVK